MSDYCDEVFVGSLFCICWWLSGELFVDVIIWKIFFMPFWKISNVDIFENMLLMQSLERYLFMPSFKIYIFMPFWKISNDNIFENMFVDEVLGKIFVNAIIWKIFFMYFWNINENIFENMFVDATIGKIFVDAVFWLPLTQSCTPPGLFILTMHFVPHQLKSLFMLWPASKSSNLQLGRPCF